MFGRQQLSFAPPGRKFSGTEAPVLFTTGKATPSSSTYVQEHHEAREDVSKYLRSCGYERRSEDGAWPELEIAVRGHEEVSGHTWYKLDCAIVREGFPRVEWQAIKRLVHLREGLHDAVKRALGEARFAEFFARTPFALRGGPPGTTGRLFAWCNALARMVSLDELAEETVALVLRFVEAPEELYPARKDSSEHVENPSGQRRESDGYLLREIPCELAMAPIQAHQDASRRAQSPSRVRSPSPQRSRPSSPKSLSVDQRQDSADSDLIKVNTSQSLPSMPSIPAERSRASTTQSADNGHSEDEEQSIVADLRDPASPASPSAPASPPVRRASRLSVPPIWTPSRPCVTWGVEAGCVHDGDASSILTRGAQFLSDKKKEASLPAYYELVRVEVLAPLAKGGLHCHVAPQAFLDGGAKASGPPGPLPQYFVINLQIPDGPPPGPFSSETKSCSSLVLYFRVRPETQEAAASSSSTDRSLQLLKRYCATAAKTPALQHKMKFIGQVDNIEDLSIPSMLAGYNGKPAMITKSGTLFHGPNYIEIDVDIRCFSYLAKQGVHQLWNRIGEMDLCFAALIQGDTSEELPERLFACAKLHKVDIAQLTRS